MTKAPKHSRSQRLLQSLGVIVALYALIGFILVPIIARGQLAPLMDARFGIDASIGQLGFNPFTFTTTIADLDFLDESGERVLALDSAVVNLQATRLLSGTISLQELTLNGLHLAVHRFADGSLNLTQILARFTASAAPSEEAAADDEQGTPPQIDIAVLHIDGASVGIVDELPATPFNILIESIDFSVENLSTLPQATAEQSFTLALGEGSQLRWDGNLSLTPLSSTGRVHLFGPITDVVYRYFKAQLPVELTGAWFDSTLDYEMGIRDDGAFDLRVDSLQASLRNLDIRALGDGELLAYLPNVMVSGGELNLLERRVAVARVQLDDFEILPQRFNDGSINFLNILPSATPSDTDVAAAENDEPSAQWDVTIAELVAESWEIKARDEVPSNPVELGIGFNARATNISNRANSPINIDTDITLLSGGALRAGGALTILPELDFDGEFALDAFSLPVLQPYLNSVANIGLDSGSFTLAGSVSSTLTQSEFNGTMSLNEVALTDRIQNEALFGIVQLQIDSASVSFGARNNIEIGQVRIQEPYARFEIEADGATNISRVVVEQEPQQITEVATTVTPQQIDLPAIMLASIVIENASADFSDRNLPLPFAVHMDALGGEVSALSTRSQEPARVSLEGQVDEYGQVTIDGRLRPLDYASLTEIDLFFRNLDIPSLSPYVIKFAGRTIADGDLDVDLSYRINDGQLDGANAMVMRNLELGERVPHPDALDLPLGLAIALLKDRNGVIDLDVPVTGELNNPQFSFGNVISRALANIITNIVSSPFRFLANLVGGDPEADIGTIEFAFGRADLAPPEREKLAQLGAALVERPQLQLGLTGAYASAADRAALQEAFLDARVEDAIEAAALASAEPLSPSALRMQVLETFTLEGVQEPEQLLAAQLSLSEMRQQHTQLDEQQEPQLDSVAYSAALRLALIARESVSEADLAALSGERAAAIEAALAGIDAQLVARVRREGEAHSVEAEQGRVPVTLSLSASRN